MSMMSDEELDFIDDKDAAEVVNTSAENGEGSSHLVCVHWCF